MSSNYHSPYVDGTTPYSASGMNAPLGELDAEITDLTVLAQGTVKDKDLTAPPGSPSNGDAYIVGGSATGDWAAKDNQIAVYWDSGWTFQAPAEGWKVYVQDENITYVYNGSSWAADAVNAHASAHVDGGSDEIDGDTIDIDFTPSNYTPDSTPAEANDVDDLAAHLKGIDDALGSGGVTYATAAEINTGTETGKVVNPDALAGSIHGTKTVTLYVIDADTALATGDGKLYWPVPKSLDGMNLVEAYAIVKTASTSGTPTFQIYNVTDSVDMLSTAITIDANETHSKDAATAAVIDTSNDDVAHGDLLRIDCDAAGTGTQGLWIEMSFRKP